MKKIEINDLPKYLQPGNKLKIFYNEGNPNNSTIHILGIVDEEIEKRKTKLIVYKKWLKHKKYWDYRVETFLFFHLRVCELYYLGKSK
jgi:hypothetical protein